MKILGLSAMALMLSLTYAAAQDDAPDAAAPGSSAPVETLTAPARQDQAVPPPSTGGDSQSGGGQRDSLRTQIDQINRGEREELRVLTERYENDRRAIYEKYRSQRQPLEQQRAQLQQQDRHEDRQQFQQRAPQHSQQQAGRTVQIKSPGADLRARTSGVAGDHHDEEWRRRERERHERERRERERRAREEARRRHPEAQGRAGVKSDGATKTTPTPAPTPVPTTAPAGR
ncbi:MAG: hypothetical protein ACHQ2Z_13305 [Elusimicrobiota bacterium]